jgi:hypothetical protein
MLTLTEQLSNRWLTICKRELTSGRSDDHSSQVHTELHFDAPVLLELLARQVLLPFVVSVTAGSTVTALKARWIKDQPVEKLRSEVTAHLGQGIRLGDNRVREECILLVEELLKPYGVTRDQARRIVGSMEATFSENETGPPRAPTDSCG